MRHVWHWLALLALVSGCNCGSKPHTGNSSGIVTVSINGKTTTEDDAALPFPESCLASPDLTPASQGFELGNAGQSALTVTSMTITGANASSFKITSTLPTSVASGSAVEVDVQFAPTVAGNQSADIVIDTDDPTKGEINVRLTGVGENLSAQASYSTACADPTNSGNDDDSCAYLNFTDTSVGASTTQTVAVGNAGCATLHITDVSFFGANLDDGGTVFHVHGAAPTSANPIAVSTGNDAGLQIDFAPADSLNLAIADMYVTTDGIAADSTQQQGFLPDGGNLPPGVIHIALQGQGTAAQVTLTPQACDYSQTDSGNACHSQFVGGASGDEIASFLLINNGNASVQVQSVTVPSDDGGAFTINLPQAAPFTIDAAGGANASAPFTVTYHPTNAVISADLVAVTSAGTLSSHLTAGSPSVLAVQTVLSFNDGGTDPEVFVSPQPLAIANAGATPLTIQQPTFTGDVLDDGGTGACSYLDTSGQPQPFFTLGAAPAFPLTLDPDAGSTLVVTHHRNPHIGGQVECNLQIPSNSLGTPISTVIVQASTFVNCDPQANADPTGTLAVSAGVDGGVYVIDGSQSFDTSSLTTPSCPNGQSDGLQLFHWTLAIAPSAPRYGTHLEARVSAGVTCNQSDDGGCVDLSISTGSTNFPPYGDAAKVNLVVAPDDPHLSNPPSLSLVVSDTTGRTSPPTPALVLTPGP